MDFEAIMDLDYETQHFGIHPRTFLDREISRVKRLGSLTQNTIEISTLGGRGKTPLGDLAYCSSEPTTSS
ncbi:UNVERIFIED_CONTAM: hypothetical protein NCL1_33714 [Trichonephila clavipes]